MWRISGTVEDTLLSGMPGTQWCTSFLAVAMSQVSQRLNRLLHCVLTRERIEDDHIWLPSSHMAGFRPTLAETYHSCHRHALRLLGSSSASCHGCHDMRIHSKVLGGVVGIIPAWRLCRRRNLHRTFVSIIGGTSEGNVKGGKTVDVIILLLYLR